MYKGANHAFLFCTAMLSTSSSTSAQKNVAIKCQATVSLSKQCSNFERSASSASLRFRHLGRDKQSQDFTDAFTAVGFIFSDDSQRTIIKGKHWATSDLHGHCGAGGFLAGKVITHLSKRFKSRSSAIPLGSRRTVLHTHCQHNAISM